MLPPVSTILQEEINMEPYISNPPPQYKVTSARSPVAPAQCVHPINLSSRELCIRNLWADRRLNAAHYMLHLRWVGD